MRFPPSINGRPHLHGLPAWAVEPTTSTFGNVAISTFRAGMGSPRGMTRTPQAPSWPSISVSITSHKVML